MVKVTGLMATSIEKVAPFVNMPLRDYSGSNKAEMRLLIKTMTPLQVEWEDTKEGTLTTTCAGGMAAHLFARELWHASSKRYTDETYARTHSGVLQRFECYTPAGFSGGGAYIDLPAQAINPWAGADAPGETQSLRYHCYMKGHGVAQDYNIDG
jgi:hypothetical protein